mgnify:CR=1 FL=1
MNLDKLKTLIRHIVNESLDLLSEDIQKGEWWIDSTGHNIFADVEVSGRGHEDFVMEYLCNEILHFFDLNYNEEAGFAYYEDDIKSVLIRRGEFSEKEENIWNSKGPSEVIINNLIKHKVYRDNGQANEAVYIAYGASQTDPRDYAMKNLGWKIMKTFGNELEIQTWHLTPSDLDSIVKGIWDICEDNNDNPLVNVTVQATGKRFVRIPLNVLEQKMAQKIQKYQSGVHTGFTEAINEDYHFHHKEYRMYEGNRHIVVAFDDNSRLKFEVHFRDVRGQDREKWRKKAASTWKSLANELYRDVPLNDALNPIQKSWKECFQEAMKDPKLKPYIRNNHHQKVFDDKGYPKSVQGKPQACIDPVNFTAH